MNIPPELLNQVLDELADRVALRLREDGSGVHARAHEDGDGWRLVSVKELATRVGRSERWVHASCRDRGLPFVRLDRGGKAFDLEDVRAWARARRVPLEDR